MESHLASRRSAFAAITLESDGPQSSQRAESPAEVGEFPQVLVHLNSRLRESLGILEGVTEFAPLVSALTRLAIVFSERSGGRGPTLLIVPMVDIVELIRC